METTMPKQSASNIDVKGKWIDYMAQNTVVKSYSKNQRRSQQLFARSGGFLWSSCQVVQFMIYIAINYRKKISYYQTLTS